jgi:hypothetical protein
MQLPRIPGTTAVPTAAFRSTPASRTMGPGLLALPFDALRHQYAGAVWAGWLPRSSLASARIERALDALERLMLGPLARHR